MHRLHIGEDIWKWYVKGWSNIIVFAPTGKRYEVDLNNYRNVAGTYAIKPSEVKEYILKNLKG